MLGEELPHEVTALLRKHATDHLGAMIEPSITEQIPGLAGSAVVVTPGTEDHPIDPGPLSRTRTHGAGLQRDDEGAARQSNISPGQRRGTQNDDLRMSGGVGQCLASIG